MAGMPHISHNYTMGGGSSQLDPVEFRAGSMGVELARDCAQLDLGRAGSTC